MPVPVADSQFNIYWAGSGGVGFVAVGVGTTGGARTTTLCRPGTSNLGEDRLSSVFLVAGNPHTKTNAMSNTQGAQARKMDFPSGLTSAGASASTLFSVSFQILAGCQKHRSKATAAREEMAATMSTSQGP